MAGYIFETVDLDPVVLEGGLRYDWGEVDPLEKVGESDIGRIRRRTFHAASGAVGILYRVGEGVGVGASLTRAFRIPDVGDLFSEGPHLAAYYFEVGNPELKTEIGLGADAFVRLTRDRIRAELAGFHNEFSDYIYPRETGKLSRVRLPIYQFQGADARLSGVEGQLEWNPAEGLVVTGTGSFVRGTLEGTREPLPLIPPLQGLVSGEYRTPSWFVSVETEFAAKQDRLGAFESATDGYAVLNLYGGVRLTLRGRLNFATVSVTNLTDVTYRNHLSRVKEIMPEAGRGVQITYRVLF